MASKYLIPVIKEYEPILLSEKTDLSSCSGKFHFEEKARLRLRFNEKGVSIMIFTKIY